MDKKISVVIPSYRVSVHILDVIKSVPDFVSHIIVIDDKCPENSGEIAKSSSDHRVIVCAHTQNLGVGGE